MAQNKIKMGFTSTPSVTIAQPDELGYSFETTYTEDSGRVQRGNALVTPMFTVEAFSFNYSFLKIAEARAIIQIILAGKPFYMFYPSVYYNAWKTNQFYVGKGDIKWGTIITSEEIVEDFAFNVVGVNPIMIGGAEPS